MKKKEVTTKKNGKDNGNGNGGNNTLTAVFVEDTKTYHLYMVSDKNGVIGNIYWPKEAKSIPTKVTLELLPMNDPGRNAGLDFLIDKTGGSGKTFKRLTVARNK